jgi:hypothetical protein
MLLKRRCCGILPHRHVAASIDGISDTGLPLTRVATTLQVIVQFRGSIAMPSGSADTQRKKGTQPTNYSRTNAVTFAPAAFGVYARDRAGGPQITDYAMMLSFY